MNHGYAMTLFKSLQCQHNIANNDGRDSDLVAGYTTAQQREQHHTTGFTKYKIRVTCWEQFSSTTTITTTTTNAY